MHNSTHFRFPNKGNRPKEILQASTRPLIAEQNDDSFLSNKSLQVLLWSYAYIKMVQKKNQPFLGFF